LTPKRQLQHQAVSQVWRTSYQHRKRSQQRSDKQTLRFTLPRTKIWEKPK
jgi:hypothetical protein